MSVAQPARIPTRGHAHPLILIAAQAIQRAGWRVTSIYRPGPGNHQTGRAMDVAPMVYAEGGFGLHTARLILAYVKRAVPAAHWWAVSELDHVHVQLAPYDAFGLNTPRGTRLVRMRNQ